MATLRCIQVVNVRWFNATAWYGVYLARLLHEAGHHSLVVGLPGSPPIQQAKAWSLPVAELSLNTSNPFRLPSLLLGMKRILRDFKPQIVNCHRGEAFPLWAALKSAQHDFKLIRTRGDQRPPRNTPVNRWLHRISADAVITTNSHQASQVMAMGVPAEHVHTIIGGVDDTCFYRDLQAGLEVRRPLEQMHNFVIGILGRLDPVKGHALLIDALGRLKRRYGKEAYRIFLVCVGADAGLHAADIQAMCAEHDIQDSVLVTGRVDNVRAYINAMDLGILASTDSEAIARAALEIMACGVPLLSSNVGVMPDILPPRNLFPAGDVEALELAIETVWQSRVKLEAMGASSSRALQGLRGADFLAKTLGVYQSTLNASSRRKKP